VTIPENIEAFAVTAINDGYVTLTEIENTIPANTGVILKATEAGVYNFAITEAVDAVENLLAGTVIATVVDGPAYVLGNVDGIGLYNAKLTDNKFLNNGYKAYLPKTAGANLTASFYGFDWNGTTAIENVEAENASNVIYDLAGRKVNAVERGIYIINGKKVLVK
jgi:hypothetical protein